MRLKMEIQRIADRIGPVFAFEVEMGHLSQGVDPGIRAPGAEKGHRFAAELLDRLFQRLLDAEPVVLALPTDKASAVVFDADFVAKHGVF